MGTEAQVTEEAIPIDESKVYDIPGVGKIPGKEVKTGFMFEADYRKKTEEISREREKNANLEGLSQAVALYAKTDPIWYNNFLKFVESGGDPSKFQTPPDPAKPPDPNAKQAVQQEPLRRPEYDQAVRDIEALKFQNSRLMVDRAMEDLSKETGIDMDTIDKEIMPIAVENMVKTKTPLQNLQNAFRIWGFDKAKETGAKEGMERIQERVRAQVLGGATGSKAPVKTDAEQLRDFLSGGKGNADTARLILRGT